MGLSNVLRSFHLNDDYDDEYYDEEDYEEEDDYEDEPGIFGKFAKDSRAKSYDYDEEPTRGSARSNFTVKNGSGSGSGGGFSKTNKVTSMRRQTNNRDMAVCVIKPSSFEDAREISETLLADRTVLLNMKGLDLSVAQRIIDFTCGTCYAIDGNLQKIEDYIFIITPSQVELTGDLAGVIDGFDVSGIKTGF